MQKNTVTTTNFSIGHSRDLLTLINGLHILSILACWLSALPLPLRILLSLLLAFSWHFQHKACSADCTYLRYTSNAGWAVAFHDHMSYDSLILKPSTVAGGMLTILHFEVKNCNKTLLIFKDAMSANDYRRLIVLLKISG